MNEIIIKGVATILIRDKDTLEIKKEITEENIITDRVHFTPAINNYNLYISESTAYNNPDSRILVLDQSFQGVDISGIPRTQPSYYPNVPEPYIEFHQRFDAPSTTRTITTVGIAKQYYSTDNRVIPYTLLRLTTPLTQTTTDIVDVIYRLQFPLTGINGEQANVLVQDYLNSNVDTSNINNTYGHPRYAAHCFVNLSNFDENSYELYIPASIVQRFGNVSSGSDTEILGIHKTVSQTFNNQIGLINQGFIWTDYNNDTNFTSTGKFVGRFVAGEMETRNINGVQSSVKTIFTKSGSTTVPFYDFVFTPTTDGKCYITGILSVTGSAPPDKGEVPRYHIIDITSSGGVGTATYRYKYFMPTRFNGNTFNIYGEQLTHLNNFTFTKHFNKDLTTDKFGLIPIKDTTFEPDPDVVNLGIVFNDTVIVAPIYDTRTPLVINSTNFPTFNATEIVQVAVASPDEIWIACANTGLYFYNFGTVTKIDPTTFGLSDPCYGVTLGPSGSILAVFNGGLAITTDNGISWTVYTPTSIPAFNPNITNWQDIAWIVGDRNSPDFRTAVIYKDATSGNYNILWWDSITGNVFVTSYGVGGTTTLDDLTNRKVYMNRVQFTPGGNWISAYIGTGGAGTKGFLTFGSDTTITPPSANISDTSPWHGADPYVVNLSSGEGFINFVSSTTWEVVDGTGTPVESFAGPVSAFDSNISASSFPYHSTYIGNGRIVYYNNTQGPYPGFEISFIRSDASDITFGALEKEIWKEYGWDGFSWVRNDPNSKVTHTTAEQLPTGFDISFDDQGGTLNFVAGEHFAAMSSWGPVFDGTVDTTVKFTLFERETEQLSLTKNNSATTPSPTVIKWLDPRTLEFTDISGTFSVIGPGTVENTFSYTFYVPTGAGSARSSIALDGDFFIEFYRPNGEVGSGNYHVVGLSSGLVGTPVTTSTQEHGFRFDPGSVSVVESGTLVGSPIPTPYGVPMTFGFRRTGTTIEYLINGNVVYTSTVASSGAKNIEITGYRFSYTYITRLENVTLTDFFVSFDFDGLYYYDPRYLVADQRAPFNITINGSPPTNILYNDLTTTLNSGEISIIPGSALIRFSSADAPATITFDGILVYNRRQTTPY